MPILKRSITLVLCVVSTSLTTFHVFSQPARENKDLRQLFDKYSEERLKLFPLEATSQGDTRYNDILPNTGSASVIKGVHDFNIKYKNSLKGYDQQKLSAEDQISVDILLDQIDRSLEGEKFNLHYMPFNQVFSLPLRMGQLGSGSGNQPFKTIKDYNDWLQRVSHFTVWADTAIANFRKGIQAGIVMPKSLVAKMIPQMESLAQSDINKSVFYGPIKNLPKDFPDKEKARLTEVYKNAIKTQLIPAYHRLAGFLRDEYLPQARATSGISALPEGEAMYRYHIHNYTTTHKTPAEIYATGLREVERITGEIEKIKLSIGFDGTNKELFEFMKTDPRFMPFKTKEEVLNAYDTVYEKIKPHLSKYFGIDPKSRFEIRETEAFRAASAPPQYNRPSEDGSRPGIFYVPILDPTKINVTGWAMESLFLHEAIPGHHYQIALQQENTSLPRLRRFGGNSAFMEGWGLYSESLGEMLGCYTDPYQKLGSLGGEIHRAIRLVVDVGLHTGKINREQAIAYMLENEALPEQEATSEIERYMATPGQALSYKIGALKIKELRDKYQNQLGEKFSLKNFHDAILKGGAMPLSVLESYLDQWAKESNKR